MAQPIKITLEKQETYKIDIDGNIWEVRQMPARFGVKLNRIRRKLPGLSKKIEEDTATEEEQDQFEEYLDFFLDALPKVLSDGTKENKSVTDWADDLTMEGITIVLGKVMEALNEATNNS